MSLRVIYACPEMDSGTLHSFSIRFRENAESLELTSEKIDFPSTMSLRVIYACPEIDLGTTE